MKNIVIIGDSGGTGQALVKRLSPQHRCYGVSRHPLSDAPHNMQHFTHDVVHGNLSFVADLPDAIHGLVYCPGSINLKPFHRLSMDDFLADYHQNVLGAVRVVQSLLPRLKKAGSSAVVFFSTVAAQSGMTFHASIAASKGALESLSVSLAAEYAGTGIRFNVIAPSLTDTPLAAPLLNTPEKREAAAKRHPLGRTGTPEELAAAAEFLLSDDTTWITGQVIGVNGGLGRLHK
ncbi:MAG: SDR family oxidoreductase [Flavobacteriales bacterium]|nr:SDR family oxidoreductase [Flavobacteriales bacterium]